MMLQWEVGLLSCQHTIFIQDGVDFKSCVYYHSSFLARKQKNRLKQKINTGNVVEFLA